MEEKQSKIQMFFQKNIVWIISFIFFMIILYLDSNYASVRDVERQEIVLKEKITKLTERIIVLETNMKTKTKELETLDARLEKKINVINRNTEHIDINENEILRLRYSPKYYNHERSN